MLIRIGINGEQVLPSQIKGKNAFLSNVILIIKNFQGKVIYIDYIDTRFGTYSPPLFLQNMKFYYEVIKISEEHVNYIECIAKAIEDKLHPLFQNKRLKCNMDVTVVFNESV